MKIKHLKKDYSSVYPAGLDIYSLVYPAHKRTIFNYRNRDKFYFQVKFPNIYFIIIMTNSYLLNLFAFKKIGDWFYPVVNEMSEVCLPHEVYDKVMKPQEIIDIFFLSDFQYLSNIKSQIGYDSIFGYSIYSIEARNNGKANIIPYIIIKDLYEN